MLRKMLAYAGGLGVAGFAVAGSSLGEIAQNVNGPLDILRQIFSFAAAVLGVFFMCLAFMRFLRFRENPQESPLSVVVSYALLGLALVGLAFIHQLALFFAAAAGVSNVVS